MSRWIGTVLLCLLIAGGCFALLRALSDPGEAPRIQTYVLATQTIPATAAPAVTGTTAGTVGTTCPQTETTVHVLNTDLNSADMEDLCTVEGIGETLARRILDARRQLGGFSYREQLLEIRGIGESMLERIFTVFVIPGEQAPPRSEPPETTPPEPASEPEVTTVTTVAALPERPFLEMNQMTLEQLRTVPGMTEQAAADILEMRTRIQYYSHPYELLLIESLDHDWIVSVLDCFYVTGVNDGVVSDHRDQGIRP